MGWPLEKSPSRTIGLIVFTSPVLDDITFKKPSFKAFWTPVTVVDPPSFVVLIADEDSIWSSPLNLAAA